jgi:hypothetical protein
VRATAAAATLWSPLVRTSDATEWSDYVRTHQDAPRAQRSGVFASNLNRIGRRRRLTRVGSVCSPRAGRIGVHAGQVIARVVQVVVVIKVIVGWFAGFTVKTVVPFVSLLIERVDKGGPARLLVALSHEL